MEPAKVRTDEIVRAASGAFNQSTDQRHYINEVHFSFHNHREIMNAIESGQAVDLAKMPKHTRTSVLIIGSGHSLDDALPMMKDWKGHIICSTSHASTLIAWGREPEHIVALDPDSNPGELAADTWEGRKSTLHLHPGVMPDLVKWWKGPMALFRKLQPQQPFYAGEQAMGYSPLGPLKDGRYHGQESPLLITAQVPMLACALSAQICIAKHLGYSQFVLVGCDFSWRDDENRFTSKTWEDGRWIDHTPGPYGSADDPEVETEFDGLKSSPMQIFYSHQVVIAWRLVEKSIINSSPGLLRMFPHVPIEEVIRRGNKGVKGFTLPKMIKATEEHLARQNIYFFYVGAGIMPHEFKDPLHDVPKMLGQVKEMLTAQGNGDKLDVEANMKRIRRLFAKVTEDTNAVLPAQGADGALDVEAQRKRINRLSKEVTGE